jgi:hypothetical protein
MAMLQLNEIFERLWRPLIGAIKAPAKEFWSEAKAAVPDLILLAEAYWGTEGRLIDLGFDFVYDKELYDSVRDGIIQDIHRRLLSNPDQQSHFARFLENHDEPRCAAVFGNDRLPAVATLMGTLPGMRFYQQGEELGIKLRTPIELRKIAEQPIDPVRKDFFAKLLAATREEVFHAGQWGLVSVTPDSGATSGNLFVYQWRSTESWKIIVANLSNAAAQGFARFDGQIDVNRDYEFTDCLDGTQYVRKGGELAAQGLFILREAYQSHLLDVKSLEAGKK